MNHKNYYLAIYMFFCLHVSCVFFLLAWKSMSNSSNQPAYQRFDTAEILAEFLGKILQRC